MKKLLFIFATILIALSAQAQQQVKQGTTKYDQLVTGNIVTISRDNGSNSRTYFTIENNAIAAHNEPNVNSLWRIVYCAYQKFDWGDQNIYQFQHLKSGKYLRVNASGSGNRVTIRFSASDNLEACSTISQNNPGNKIDGAEQGALNYNYNNRDYYIKLQNNNTWVLQTGTNNRPTLFVEKWAQNTSTSFESYFSPETYDFGLVKAKKQDGQMVANDEVVANKTIRFVMDKRETTVYSCARDNRRKQIEFGSTVESDLTQMGITDITFAWQSSGNDTSMLTLSANGYSSDKETVRKMLDIASTPEKSDDNIAYEIPIRAYGKSPLNLKHKQNANLVTWSNYVDYLVATWYYGNNKDPYTATARVVRKSYRVEDLPEFEYSTSPSTFTFEGERGSQTFKINGIHQHGTAYYDVDGRIADKDYEYGPVPMPIAEDKGKLSYAFTFKDLNGNTIDWLSHNYDAIKDKINNHQTPDTTITVTANANDANNATYRQAKLHGVVTLKGLKNGQSHEHEGDISISINQRAVGGGNIKLKHSKGASGDALDGNGRQQVHTAERTIYYLPNQDIQLRLAESNFFGYMRWYDYASGGEGGDPYWNPIETSRTSWATSPRGANGNAFKAINTSYGNSRGLYATAQDGQLTNASENNPAPVLKGWDYGTYDPNEPTEEQKTKAIHTIACDVSAYTDYTIWKNASNANRTDSIQEPTLSYRQLFHLRPAEEMAKQLNDKSFLNTPEFLENYKYRAAVGADVHLATKYRYKSYTGSHESELCYFFYNKQNQLKRVGKDAQAEWYMSTDGVNWSKINNPEYQVYDYLNIDSDVATTVVYSLQVPTSATGLDNPLLIAKFEVQFVNINECGPRKDAIITDHDINEHFIPLKKIDFNFKDDNGNFTADTITIGGDFKQLDYHLPWDQSTYGYFYPKSNKYNKNSNYIGQTNNNHNSENIPYYGEYFLVNKINKQWAKATAHGGANDFALYVDGTTEPGVVVSISTDAVICAGQTLYCSAWLCNPCPTSFDYNSPRNPIFRCNVEGRTKKVNPVGNDTWNDWEDISVFFVGQLPKGSGWQQIVFPVESDKSYDETRVSIYNFATGGSGNDFMVDDICLFASQLPLASYQAQTNCASDANTESSTAVILRIDYTEFQGRRDQYMYYHIFKEKNSYDQNDTEHPVSLKETLTDNSAYYHDNPGDVLQKSYGSVLIPQYDMVPTAGGSDGSSEPIKIYNSVQEFKDALVDEIQTRKTNANGADYEKSIHGKAYIQTTTNDGTTKWLLYVMHIIPNAGETDELINNLDENKYLFEHYDYTLRMANVPEELNAPECNMQTPLHATQSTEFDLYNGCGSDPLVTGFLPKKDGLCPNNLYTLHSMIENVMAPKTGTTLQEVRGSVMADWLVGFDFDDIYADTKQHDKDQVAAAKTAFEAKYGYSRAAIKTALLYDLRRPSTEYDKNCNRDATSFEELDINCFLEEVNYYIIKDLYERGLLQLGKRTSTFYLGSQDTVRYWIYPIDGTAEGTINGTKVALHDCSEPVWVMVSSAQTNKMLNISPLTQAEKKAKLEEYPTIMSEIPTIRVRKSDLSGEITVTVQEAEEINGVEAGSQLTFGLNTVEFFDYEKNEATTKPATFEVGKRYTIRVPFEQGGAICPASDCQDVLYFHLLVLPDAVIWTPAADSYNGWGLDENWRGWDDKDKDGVVDEGETMGVGFVPIAGSNVVIPSLGDPTLYPYIHDHNHYPMHVNAHPHICNDIYFEPGAHLHNQHLLQYDSAFVDMQITAGAWNMVSAPMKNMVSGDMYIPHTGNWQTGSSQETAGVFEVSGFQGARHTDAAYVFWQGFYNTTVDIRYEGKTNLKQASSANFVYSNALNQPLQVGSGYQLYGLGLGEQQLVVRLPKPDTEYYYYTPEGYKSEKLDAVSTADRNKLAYDGEMEIKLENKVENSSSFLFGNPTMAYIDMSLFLADNAEVLNPVFHRVENNAWRSATEMTLQSDRYLAPMTSVMLETNGQVAKDEITVILKPEHLTLNNHIYTVEEQSDDQEQQPAAIAPRAKADDSSTASEIMTIYTSANGAYARTVLATNPAANDYYQIGEDALFISTGVESQSAVTTPLNMYTVAEQVPMMADVRQGISQIPLAILAANGYRSQYMQVAFYLSSNWSRECYFCDSQTGQKIRIMDGLVISVEMPLNHEQRYYIEGPDEYLGSSEGGVTTSTTTPSADLDQKAWAYSPAMGTLVVAANDMFQQVRIYDMAGRLLTDKTFDLLHHTATLTAPTGVCIVETVMRDGTAIYTQTIVK